MSNQSNEVSMKVIAHIRSEFREKFGIPRQAGLVPELTAEIVFEPEYRVPAAFKGLEDFTHIWILWQFSKAVREDWSPTVLPPRLGGKTHMGVFATRSPFRPNEIGLSSVKLEKIDFEASDGPILTVSGADLMDGTPIFDIKPYLAYTDSHPEASGGFTDQIKEDRLDVVFPQEWLDMIPKEKRTAATALLASDPRPRYQDDPERRYGMAYAGYDIRFHVDGQTLTVCEVEKLK